MYKPHDKRTARSRRHARIRRDVAGTPRRPRLSVFRSLNHIYAQLIDDTSGATLAAASTNEPEIRADLAGPKRARALVVGRKLAERARGKGIEAVVFDRGGYVYHGRVRALAEGAREGGLQF